MSPYQGPRPTPTNYSKFDSIIDSDDEDDASLQTGTKPGPPASLDHLAKTMPPHLYRKLTEAQVGQPRIPLLPFIHLTIAASPLPQMAAASGDHATALRAQQELNAELERGPPEFREAFAKAQRLRGSGAHRGGGRVSSKGKDTSELTPHEVRAQLQQQSAKLAQLQQAEQMQARRQQRQHLCASEGRQHATHTCT